jgi:uncharacterized protein YbjQ (UPF0145 family)
MLITTTPTIAGHRITAVHGEVFGLVVRSRGLGPNLLASLRSFGGGEIVEYTRLLEETRKQAIARLEERAHASGGNAIVSMRFDSSAISGYMSEIVAYGTAVTVMPDERVGQPDPAQE